jgi:hypothetical protein
VLWKSNKKVLQCQFISEDKEKGSTAKYPECAEKLIGDRALKEFSERLAECENLSEIVGGKIGAGNV